MLLQRNGVYTYRKVIPPELRPFMEGKREVWRSGLRRCPGTTEPVQLANWYVTALTLAPGVGALMWADKLAGQRRA